MRVFFGPGFTVRLALTCLLAGIAIGLYLGASAAGNTASGGPPAVTAPESATARNSLTGEEVKSWSRTSTSSSCSGC